MLLLLVVTAVLAGCSSMGMGRQPESYLRPDVDLGFVNRVAVLPFENHTDDKFAAERARNIVITELLARGGYDVVDKGVVDSIMQEEALEKDAAIDLNSLKRLGQRLKVQAFVLGSVDQSGDVRRGSTSFPEVAMTLRLVDAKGSVIIWQASGYKNGDSFVDRMFGIAPDDAFQVTLKLVRELLSTLPAK